MRPRFLLAHCRLFLAHRLLRLVIWLLPTPIGVLVRAELLTPLIQPTEATTDAEPPPPRLH